MSDIVSPLLEWLNANPELAGLVTFIISASESVAIIGTIVPGSITMTAIGALAGAGVIPLWSTIFYAILGAIIGDGISYWIGYHFKDKLKTSWPFKKHPGLLETGESFVHKYGVMSVFIGRFIGPVRALVPLVAGMLGMKPVPFIIANVTSAIGWAPVYMLPGILLGAVSLELPPDIAVHVMLVLVLITLFIILCLWLTYKLIVLFHTQIEEFQNWIWPKLKMTRLLKHRNPAKEHGQLTLAFYFLLTTLSFIALITWVKIHGSSKLMVNDAMHHLFRGIRTQNFDTIMINITLLGQKEIILPVVIVIFGLFLIQKHWRIAFHVLALGIMAAGSVFVLKNLLKSPRPWGIFQNAETFSLPSGHTTIATTIFMGLTFLIARSVKPKFRWPIYVLGISLSLMVGISRLYLGAHWFTDVIGSFLLASAILMVVILSYERHPEKEVNPLIIAVVFLASLSVIYGIYHHLKFEQLKINYAQVSYPTKEIDMNDWWMNNDSLPAYSVSLFGFPSSPINLVWAGKIDKIEETLLKEGWATPPARDLVSTLHRIADIESTEYLSMVSPQYLDNRPTLILAKRGATDSKGLLVLRLWDSHRIISETQSTLWVGTVAIVPRSYSWLYKSHPSSIAIDPSYIFPNKSGIGRWEWKVMMMNPPGSRLHKQKIMLIRENKKVHAQR